jgi:DNA-binding transcriptional LysR family regulator
MPRRLALTFAQIWPLRVFKLPFKFPPVTTQIVWHRRTAEDAPVTYLRDMIASACEQPAA